MLDELYLSGGRITGVDINHQMIEVARTDDKGLRNEVHFVHWSESKRNQRFNIVFSLSVLCNWPALPEESLGAVFSLDEFEQICGAIDKAVLLGGYLVIVNSNYVLRKQKYFGIHTTLRQISIKLGLFGDTALRRWTMKIHERVGSFSRRPIE